MAPSSISPPGAVARCRGRAVLLNNSISPTYAQECFDLSTARSRCGGMARRLGRRTTRPETLPLRPIARTMSDWRAGHPVPQHHCGVDRGEGQGAHDWEGIRWRGWIADAWRCARLFRASQCLAQLPARRPGRGQRARSIDALGAPMFYWVYMVNKKPAGRPGTLGGHRPSRSLGRAQAPSCGSSVDYTDAPSGLTCKP
jgi:hypothetical protein